MVLMSAVIPAPDDGSWPAMASTTGSWDFFFGAMAETEFVQRVF
jgi:hypothetical protein